MDLDVNDEQETVISATSEFLDSASSKARVGRLWKCEAGFDKAFRSRLSRRVGDGCDCRQTIDLRGNCI